MTEFTASNGITVFVRDGGTVQFQHGTRAESCGILQVMPHSEWWQTLREFFQHERDETLGRWRWPEHPDFLVYSRGYAGVRVTSESSGGHVLAVREAAMGWQKGQSTYFGAARAYFEAHPERKPWHDAKPGETWRLTVRDRDPLDLDLTFNVIGVTDHVQARFARPQVSGEQMEYSIDSDAIVAGRRIWPEDAS